MLGRLLDVSVAFIGFLVGSVASLFTACVRELRRCGRHSTRTPGTRTRPHYNRASDWVEHDDKDVNVDADAGQVILDTTSSEENGDDDRLPQ